MEANYFMVFTLHRSLWKGVEDITGFYIFKAGFYPKIEDFMTAIKFNDAIIQSGRQVVGITGITPITEEYAETYNKTQYKWIDLTV